MLRLCGAATLRLGLRYAANFGLYLTTTEVTCLRGYHTVSSPCQVVDFIGRNGFIGLR